MNRDDNLKTISNLLPAEQFVKILEKCYSDKTIEFASNYAPTASAFANTKYSPQSVEKLMSAMHRGDIDRFDVMAIIKLSTESNANEKDIDRFLGLIDKGMFKRTALSIFLSHEAQERGFDKAVELVNSGIYKATDKGICLDPIIAREMFSMGMTLTAVTGVGSYTVTDIYETLAEGHGISFPDDKLAAEIDRMRNQPGWTKFKIFLKQNLGSDIDKLSPSLLREMQQRFQNENSLSVLSAKISWDYERFIEDIKEKSPEVIVKSAYEIHNKGCIEDFCRVNDLHLDPEDIKVLLERDDLLDEIYQEWDTMGQLHGFAEIDTAIDEVAYRLRTAKAEEKVQEQKKAAITEKKPDTEKPAPQKTTKRKGR